MKKVLVNISNHPSSSWSNEMMEEAAGNWDKIIDIPFPAVNASYSGEQVEEMANEIYVKLPHLIDNEVNEPRTTTCMVQGETSLVYYLTNMLKASGIPIVVACSERNTVMNEDGTKTVAFEFKQFRSI